MTVYVDRVQLWTKTRQWRYDHVCHLTADTEKELHAFATGKLGLKRGWFQRSRICDHYDITRGKRQLALVRGAVVGIALSAGYIAEEVKRQGGDELLAHAALARFRARITYDGGD